LPRARQFRQATAKGHPPRLFESLFPSDATSATARHQSQTAGKFEITRAQPGVAVEVSSSGLQLLYPFSVPALLFRNRACLFVPPTMLRVHSV